MEDETLVALGSILVAIISIVLNYWERSKAKKNPYSEALYAKQVEFIALLFESFSELATYSEALRAAIEQKEKKITTQVIQIIDEKFKETAKLISRMTPFMSNDVINAITKYSSTFMLLIDTAESNDYSKLENVMKMMRTSEVSLTLETRKMLGTDVLTEETINLFEKNNTLDYKKVLETYSEGYHKEFVDIAKKIM